jgi:CheY-like chemotaxis protein
VLGDVLRREGYNVLPAGNGADALDLEAQHEGPIHLLVTDLRMPGMSGRELAEHLATRRPGLRRLYVSGHADDEVREWLVSEPATPFLQKPFTPSAFAATVRQALSRG